MATEELFRDDADLLDCEARVTAVHTDPEGRRWLVLDRTVFYPTGGGQAADTGTLELADGRVWAIDDTRKRPPPESGIGHRLAQGVEDADEGLVGRTVRARIDAARRSLHRRFHTATHLLCALVPHPVDGCSITTDYARLDFHTAEALDAAALDAGLSRLIAEDHAVKTRWVDEAELDAHPEWVRSMSVKPPRGSGRVRLVEVEGVDFQPCGGTHARRTGELAGIHVAKIEKKGALSRRVVLRLR